MTNVVFLLRESAQLVYGGEEHNPLYERDLVKAQFVVELIEGLGYPLSLVHVDVPVLVEGDGFQQIDAVAEGEEKDVIIAAVVEAPQEYENRQELRMRGLYLQAAALAKTRRVRLLVYYTRWYRKGVRQKRQIAVDYAKYPTYHAWQAAGFPSLGVLPAYEKENEG